MKSPRIKGSMQSWTFCRTEGLPASLKFPEASKHIQERNGMNPVATSPGRQSRLLRTERPTTPQGEAEHELVHFTLSPPGRGLKGGRDSSASPGGGGRSIARLSSSDRRRSGEGPGSDPGPSGSLSACSYSCRVGHVWESGGHSPTLYEGALRFVQGALPFFLEADS